MPIAIVDVPFVSTTIQSIARVRTRIPSPFETERPFGSISPATDASQSDIDISKRYRYPVLIELNFDLTSEPGHVRGTNAGLTCSLTRLVGVPLARKLSECSPSPSPTPSAGWGPPCAGFTSRLTSSKGRRHWRWRLRTRGRAMAAALAEGRRLREDVERSEDPSNACGPARTRRRANATPNVLLATWIPTHRPSCPNERALARKKASNTSSRGSKRRPRDSKQSWKPRGEP
eukprot:scaffold287_cov337-Pavlova_lutheri.AAC.207